MIRGIHHVHITVPIGEENLARAFYCGVLGLIETPKPATLRERGGFWLIVGDRELHIGVEPALIDRSDTKAHVAFEVDDVEIWRERLQRAGFAPDEAPPMPGYARFYVRDPFGNRIELIQRL